MNKLSVSDPEHIHFKKDCHNYLANKLFGRASAETVEDENDAGSDGEVEAEGTAAKAQGTFQDSACMCIDRLLYQLGTE